MTALEKTGAQVRAELGHPVIDGDGHILEFMPQVFDYVADVGGPKMADAYKATLGQRGHRDVWWTRPSAEHSIDTLTAMLPGLYVERQAELGFDFSVLYPSMGLGIGNIGDADLRAGVNRAYNLMNWDLYGPYQDRLTPAACIPNHNPDEAIAELEFACGELGFKIAMLTSEIRKPLPEIAAGAPDLAANTVRVYSLGIDAEFDFDPMWQKLVDLKVTPTCHTKTIGIGSNRNSTTNFVFNHLGAFASGSDFMARSVFMGGVTRRFPELNFGLLEGGVGWGCQLFNDLVEHWEKRNKDALLKNLDPRKLDQALAEAMFAKYGNERMTPARIRTGSPFRQVDMDFDEAELDEFAACAIEKAEDIEGLFAKPFYFGCEADDAMVPVAFDKSLHHFGATFNAIFSSDVGHWDVVDILKVLPEAYKFVETGRLDNDQFRAFTFEHAVRLFGEGNPAFFKGTAVEAEAAAVLGARSERAAAE
jgi:predicted TIM-barrel fold metal-dependent hydrolase